MPKTMRYTMRAASNFAEVARFHELLALGLATPDPSPDRNPNPNQVAHSPELFGLGLAKPNPSPISNPNPNPDPNPSQVADFHEIEYSAARPLCAMCAITSN